MKFTWDETKRLQNLVKHGVDFADAEQIFQGPTLVHLDDRHNYGETRFIALGCIQGRPMVMVFTEPDASTVRVISLRKATRYEEKELHQAIRH
jgi:uncharacterized DUF497 family protein